MYKLELYSRDHCAYCQMAKRLLTSRGYTYEEYDATHDIALAKTMHKRSNRRSVPQIFFNQQHIGGFEDLQLALKEGRLDPPTTNNKEDMSCPAI